ncbi:MAG: hypothetical protein WKG03_19130, partial [Telluria sp.]
MIDASYQREIEGMRQMLAQSTAKKANSSDLKRRTIVAASLYNLLPSIPQSEYPRILDSLALYQEWAVRDQVHLHLVDSLQVEGRVPAPTDQPGIFCSYHLGSYRLLIPYLISKKLKITLLIDSDVANLQRKNFEEVIRRSAQRFGADADCCHIIDTAKAGVMFTMLKEHKRGRSLAACRPLGSSRSHIDRF